MAPGTPPPVTMQDIFGSSSSESSDAEQPSPQQLSELFDMPESDESEDENSAAVAVSNATAPDENSAAVAVSNATAPDVDSDSEAGSVSSKESWQSDNLFGPFAVDSGDEAAEEVDQQQAEQPTREPGKVTRVYPGEFILDEDPMPRKAPNIMLHAAQLAHAIAKECARFKMFISVDQMALYFSHRLTVEKIIRANGRVNYLIELKINQHRLTSSSFAEAAREPVFLISGFLDTMLPPPPPNATLSPLSQDNSYLLARFKPGSDAATTMDTTANFRVKKLGDAYQVTETIDQDNLPIPLSRHDRIYGLWIQVTQKHTMMGDMCKCFTYKIHVEAEAFISMTLHYAAHCTAESTKIIDIGFLLETALPSPL